MTCFGYSEWSRRRFVNEGFLGVHDYGQMVRMLGYVG
jgi:hypothetical protein